MVKEVMRITLFGKLIGGDYVSVNNFEKLLDELKGMLVSKTEAELLKIFKSVVVDVGNTLSKLNGARFERLMDFDASVFDALVGIRNRLVGVDLEIDNRFMLWDIKSRGDEYDLPIIILEVTNDGKIYMFEGNFILSYNSETKKSSVNVGLWHKTYISFTHPYITDYNIKREIARKLFRNPVTGVVEVEVIPD
jgi:hypothetical protein